MQMLLQNSKELSFPEIVRYVWCLLKAEHYLPCKRDLQNFKEKLYVFGVEKKILCVIFRVAEFLKLALESGSHFHLA